MESPVVLKAVATTFDHQNDWMLHIQESDGSFFRIRQSILLEDHRAAPEWLEAFWDGAQNLKAEYRKGDVVQAGPGTLAVYKARSRVSLESTEPNEQHGDVFNQHLPEEWSTERIRLADQSRVSAKASGADDDRDSLFGSDPEDDGTRAPVAPRDRATPQSTIPTRRPRSPTSDNDGPLAPPPPKRNIFEQRARRRARDEALSHRHLLASERLARLPPPPPESQSSVSPSPVPEAPRVLRPISVKARLGLNWSRNSNPLTPGAFVESQSESRASTTPSTSASEVFRPPSTLLTHDPGHGGLVERRFVRTQESREAESLAVGPSPTAGAATTTVAVESPFRTTGAGSWVADSPLAMMNWSSPAARQSTNRPEDSPLASTVFHAPTPHGQVDLGDFEDDAPQEQEEELPDFEDVQEPEGDLPDYEDDEVVPDSEQARSGSSKAGTSSSYEPLPASRRWTPVVKPEIPDEPTGWTGVIKGFKR